jgi:hypothetical protein
MSSNSKEESWSDREWRKAGILGRINVIGIRSSIGTKRYALIHHSKKKGKRRTTIACKTIIIAKGNHLGKAHIFTDNKS